MEQVTVFVDDAVLGRLPDVCAKDGVPTEWTFTITEEVGRSNRLGILWLLVLAGPLGWIVLLALAGRDRGERLTLQLPFSEAAHERYKAATGLRRQAVVVLIVALLGCLLVADRADPGMAGALALGAVVSILVTAAIGVAVASHRMRTSLVDIELDASRRWVTLSRVHPAFVEACRQQPDRHRL